MLRCIYVSRDLPIYLLLFFVVHLGQSSLMQNPYPSNFSSGSLSEKLCVVLFCSVLQATPYVIQYCLDTPDVVQYWIKSVRH